VTSPGRVLILGAGPCGLGAAYRLAELGHHDFLICEREDRVGGLAASVSTSDGFSWDLGCHVLFSRSPYFNGVMDQVLTGEWTERRRDASVWLGGRFVPYPLQYNLHRLPPQAQRDAVVGLIRAARETREPANFLDWIGNAFGDGLARHFMVPYNEKIWAAPLETMSLDWIAERVPRPDLERAILNLLDARDDSEWGPNALFRYPRTGGIGAVWRAVGDRIGEDRIALHREAISIDASVRRVRFADGGEERYDALVSTIPIDRLVALAGLDALRPAAGRLVSTTVHVVGLGVRGETPAMLRDRMWVYFPDPTVPFYRATILSNFSPENVPPGHWSFLLEVSESEARPLQDREALVETVIAAALREGFVARRDDVVATWRSIADPGYPTPTKDRDRLLASIHPVLEKERIFSRGRFGMWKYEISNQDHAFLQGAELVGRLVHGEPERLVTIDLSAHSAPLPAPAAAPQS
jgi:protoporphyrinogen oxidase